MRHSRLPPNRYLQRLRLAHSQRGVAAVEMALILIPLTLLTLATIGLGHALQEYNSLVKATRGAVRYLSQQSLDNPANGETAESLRLKAKSLVVCGAYDCTGLAPSAPGLSLDIVHICDYVSCPASHALVETGMGSARVVSVSIGQQGAPYPYTPIVPLMDWTPLTFRPISLSMVAGPN